MPEGWSAEDPDAGPADPESGEEPAEPGEEPTDPGEETGETTSPSDNDEDENEPEPTGLIGKTKAKLLKTPAGKFAKANPFASGVIVGLSFLIVVLVVVLIVRAVKNSKKKRKGKARPFNGNISI